MNELSSIVNFFFEVGILNHTIRSGNKFLGSGKQNVASHIFRTIVIGYTMSKILNADTEKVLLMCLFHDIEETRTGDLNYFQQLYVKSDDDKALNDILKNLPFKDEIEKIIQEYASLETLESQIAKDADTLELILFLKEEKDKGNEQAQNWIDSSKRRLITDLSKKILISIESTKYYEWWYNIRDDWANGNKKW
ncbi:MAG: HD domain-containing protein [Deferribacterales bacterium]